ncbi:hypothetical protein ACP70R_037531 [Stipagrostis hirtigluma subsp. patula]
MMGTKQQRQQFPLALLVMDANNTAVKNTSATTHLHGYLLAHDQPPPPPAASLVVVEVPALSSRAVRSALLLVANYAALFVGSLSSSMLSRFPALLRVVLASSSALSKPFGGFTPWLALYCVLLGLVMGLNNLLYSCDASYLPVSTTSLLLSMQLTFTLALAAALVRVPLSVPNLNAVVMTRSRRCRSRSAVGRATAAAVARTPAAPPPPPLAARKATQPASRPPSAPRCCSRSTCREPSSCTSTAGSRC